ncbi:MAG: glycosyltransferase [Acidobacteriota bacterium]|nr:glycosyltransferase [Acidobacteriota bacterium]
MKLLLTTDAVGGVWNFSLALARALPFEVHLATMGRELSAAQRLEAADFPLHESEFPLEWMPEPWEGVDAAGQWLLQLESKIEPDLIHHGTLVQAHLPFRAPSLVTVHSCVLSWWLAVKGEQAPVEWDEYRNRIRRSLKAASAIVAPSRWMLNAALRLYGKSGRNTRVIPNFTENPGAPAQKEPFVFAAGRVWDKGKNISALLEVAPQVSWPVHVAGEGSEIGHLPAAEIGKWYARAAIYAWPAKYEPFGLSVLEAAQHGCALVLGDIPSLRENWEGAAHFVHSKEDLQGAIERLIADPALRNELAARARARAACFRPEVTVEGYSAAYAEVLSGIRPSIRPGVLCAS